MRRLAKSLLHNPIDTVGRDALIGAALVSAAVGVGLILLAKKTTATSTTSSSTTTTPSSTSMSRVQLPVTIPTTVTPTAPVTSTPAPATPVSTGVTLYWSPINATKPQTASVGDTIAISLNIGTNNNWPLPTVSPSGVLSDVSRTVNGTVITDSYTALAAGVVLIAYVESTPTGSNPVTFNVTVS